MGNVGIETGGTAPHVWKYPELHLRVMVYATALVLVLVNTALADAFMPHGLEWSSLPPTTAVVAGVVMTLGLVLGGFGLVRRRSASESTAEEHRAPKIAVSEWQAERRLPLLALMTVLAFLFALIGFGNSHIGLALTGLLLAVTAFLIFAVILFLKTLGLVLGGFGLVRRRSASESTAEELRPPKTAVSGSQAAWRLPLVAILTAFAFLFVLIGFGNTHIGSVATGLWIFAVILFFWPRALFRKPPPNAQRDANRRVLGALLVFCLGVVIALNGATVNLGPGGRGPWIGPPG